MDWSSLIVLVLAGVVYGIVHLISIAQETRRPQPPAPPSERGRSVLDERVEAARQRREPAVVKMPPPLPAVVKPRRPLPPPLPRFEPPPRAEPASPPPPLDVPGPAKSLPETARPARRAPAAHQLLALLRDPRSRATALLLQEVLGPPLARRGPRRR